MSLARLVPTCIRAASFPSWDLQYGPWYYGMWLALVCVVAAELLQSAKRQASLMDMR